MIHLTIPILLAFVTIYELSSPFYKTERQRAYILSTISSITMSALSLSFVYSYFTKGLIETMRLNQDSLVGKFAVVFFGTYLFADLAVGYVRYPKQVGLLTGWIHHTVYIGLMTYMLLDGSRLTPIFLIGAFMEIPTVDLALSNLFPVVRNDLRFLTSFLFIRIMFNALLLVDCARPSSRVEVSWIPTIMLSLAGIMHVWWFHGGLTGYLRRSKQGKRKQVITSTISKDGDVVDPILNAVEHIEPSVLETTLPSSSISISSTATATATATQMETQTPEDSPLTTPRTPIQTPYTFPIPIPNLANFANLSNLPTVHIPTLSISDFKSKSQRLALDPSAFKDAVKNRWEGSMGIGIGLGALGRRRAGTETDVSVQVREVLVDEGM